MAALLPAAALAAVDHPIATGGLVLGAGLLYLGWNAPRRTPAPADWHATAAVRRIVGTPYRRLGATGEGAPDRPSARR